MVEVTGRDSAAQRYITPLDAQNQTNPAQYAQRLEAMGAGIINDLTHPADAIQSMADSAAHMLEHDPGRFVGSLLPNLATDGVGDIAAETAETAGAGLEDARLRAATAPTRPARRHRRLGMPFKKVLVKRTMSAVQACMDAGLGPGR